MKSVSRSYLNISAWQNNYYKAIFIHECKQIEMKQCGQNIIQSHSKYFPLKIISTQLLS